MSDKPPEGAVQEYQELRREILQWQTIRLVLLGFSLTVVPAVLAINRPLAWQIRSMLALIVLVVAAMLTIYAERGNAIMSGYIRKFIEPYLGGIRWERRYALFPKTGLRLNTYLALLYILLGAVAPVGAFLSENAAQAAQPAAAQVSVALGPGASMLVFVLAVILFGVCLRMISATHADIDARWDQVP